MKSFEIYGSQIINNAMKIDDTLIITDLHLGYESSLNNQGLMIPQFQYEKILDSLIEIQNIASADNILINGDIKHNFAKISKQEWKEVLDFIDYLQDNFIDIILIKGNHDNFTEYITKKRDLELCNEYILNEYLITHGHKLPEKIPTEIETIIIGHEHPCIGIRSGERVEKVKAYLKGYWNNYQLLVQPSFNQISYGSDVLHEKTISPFIKNVADFEVYAVEEYEIYPFGSLKDILSVEEKYE